MKKPLLNIACLGLLSSSAFGVVTITSANVVGFQDASGDALSAGVLALLVVDGGGDGFSAINETSTFAINDFFSDGNDEIVNIVESLPPAGFAVNPFIQGVGTSPLTLNLDSNITTGDEYAVYWFPALTTSSTQFTAGDSYGITRGTDWIIPADNTSTVNPSSVTSAGPANFTVASIPEPSSTALLGLGGFAFLARRRRA